MPFLYMSALNIGQFPLGMAATNAAIPGLVFGAGALKGLTVEKFGLVWIERRDRSGD